MLNNKTPPSEAKAGLSKDGVFGILPAVLRVKHEDNWVTDRIPYILASHRRPILLGKQWIFCGWASPDIRDPQPNIGSHGEIPPSIPSVFKVYQEKRIWTNKNVQQHRGRRAFCTYCCRNFLRQSGRFCSSKYIKGITEGQQPCRNSTGGVCLKRKEESSPDVRCT